MNQTPSFEESKGIVVDLCGKSITHDETDEQRTVFSTDSFRSLLINSFKVKVMKAKEASVFSIGVMVKSEANFDKE